eukprot:5655793-Alexandrium_andersonii.AAC.1
MPATTAAERRHDSSQSFFSTHWTVAARQLAFQARAQKAWTKRAVDCHGRCKQVWLTGQQR